MIRQRLRYRVTGAAAVDRYIVSKRRLALSSQEVIASLALLSLGLGMALPWGGITSAAYQSEFAEMGGMQLWGAIFLAVAVPQVLGIVLGYLGYIELTFGHNARVASLFLTSGLFLFSSGIWISAGSFWAGGVWNVIFAVAAAAAARHVHLYNGRTNHEIRLPAEVSELLGRPLD